MNEANPLEGAYCASPGVDPEQWYSDDRDSQRLIARLCHSKCPVVEECLKLGLRAEAAAGYWAFGVLGGLTPFHRQRILDRLKARDRGTLVRGQGVARAPDLTLSTRP